VPVYLPEPGQSVPCVEMVWSIWSETVQESKDTFAERFRLAQQEALRTVGAGGHVVDLWYGCAGGNPQMPQQIGLVLGVTPERVRQILRRSLLVMHCLGRRQIATGETGRANALLLRYLEKTLRPGEPDSLERMVGFAQRELPWLPLQTHALPLMVHLLYDRGDRSRYILSELTRCARSNGIMLPALDAVQANGAGRQLCPCGSS
jgi:hypothetical protein